MTTRSSPTLRRRRLSKELRQIRKGSGKTREQVSDYVGCSPVTVTRIESAQTAGTVAIVARMLEFYGISGDRLEALLTLCRQARRRGWWQQYADTVPNWFEIYVGLEEEVCEVRTYQPEAIFGLLQTEDYIRAMMLADVTIPPDEELERRIAVRLRRQERLLGPDAPKLWLVLGETALRREVGGGAVMREQLRHLVTLSRQNNINLQVLPNSAGAHPGMDGAFEILHFPEPGDPDVVYVQYRQGSLYLEEPSDINAYTELFDHLRARALGPDESRSLITRVAEELA